MLKIIPLGGLGEIGLNMMVFEYEETLFVIDAGLMFPEDYMLGVDFVIPDMLSKRTGDKVSGIVLTHAHEDHIGALPYLLKDINAPVFGTPFTLGLVRHKLEEHGCCMHCPARHSTRETSSAWGPSKSNLSGSATAWSTGSALPSIPLTGSSFIPAISKSAIHHLGGMVTDVGRFAQCGEKGVLALLSDSTNVKRKGTPFRTGDRRNAGQNHRSQHGADHHRPVCFQHHPHPADRRHCRPAWAQNCFQR